MSVSSFTPLAPAPPTAASSTFTPTGNLAATTVAGALGELDTEKVAKAGDTMTGALALTGAAVSTDVLTAKVVGDAALRFVANANGRLEWADGAQAADLFVERINATTFSFRGVSLVAPAQTSSLGLGVSALSSLTTGVNNTAIGTSALAGTTDSAHNTAVGNGALASQTALYGVTAVGQGAGSGIGNAVQSACLFGYNTSGATGANAFGYLANASGVNSVAIGRDSASSALGAFAVGYKAAASAAGAVAIGSDSGGNGAASSVANEFVFGTTNHHYVFPGSYAAIGTNPSGTGTVRLPSGSSIKFRDSGNANDQYLALMSDAITYLYGGTTVEFAIGGVVKATIGDAYLSVGANPASVGVIRLPNAKAIRWRNAANDADSNSILVDAGNHFNYTSGDWHRFFVSTTEVLSIRGTTDILTTLPITTSGAYVAVGAAPAQSGILRLPNDSYITVRKAANDTDYNLLKIGADDQVYFGCGRQMNINANGVGINTFLNVTGAFWASSYLSTGTNAAASGAVRLPNNATVTARNAANDADLPLLFADTSNGTTLWASTGNYITLVANAATVVTITGAAATMADGKNIAFGTTTGTKIGSTTNQKLAVWNATPDVQPTTAITGATFAEGAGGTAINTSSTFDGYTMAQVVAGLRRFGALA